MIRERCSCGAKFETDSEDAIKLVREWRKRHTCLAADVNDTPTSGLSDTQLSLGFQPGEIPAKDYDPWEESSKIRANERKT